MFIRRIYYSNLDGRLLHQYMMRGDIIIQSAETIAAELGLADYGLMEWLEPDDTVEQAFLDSHNRVSIDLSGENPALVFDYSSLPDVSSELADMQTALETLGIEKS